MRSEAVKNSEAEDAGLQRFAVEVFRGPGVMVREFFKSFANLRRV